ncbi:hypothetical protein Y032_0011g1354 [Ancylostoma ceylanicum]|uniref:Structure-specific endonuclease subunit SLX1 C-terminal domain-containing protein n=1 Tax=Ancylostoma ceylanicum TaxID=53326 RepID=A0A016VG44_9BILA|nr:hypothetical protein Y032_0011g1354 [Ancylostoma ceylanicum]
MNSRPFDRFALTFRWLLPLEELPFPEEILPPKHVLKKYGLIEKSTSEVPSQKGGYVERGECRLCGEDIELLSQLVRCPSVACAAHFHAKCLASHGLANDRCQLYPLEGKCPRYFHTFLGKIAYLVGNRMAFFEYQRYCRACIVLNFRCGRHYLWGDVIRDQRMVLKIDEAQADSSLKGLVPRASSL